MKLMAELTESVEFIVEKNEAGGKNYFIKGPFLQSEIANKNKRMYPKSVLANEVKRYNEEYVTKKRAFGELGHPDGPTINLDRVSHMIVGLEESGNDFIGKAKIMDTPMGNIVKTLIDEGANLGVSSRGMGSLKEGKGGIAIVQDDYHLSTAADIVADPSAPNAFVQGIMEGVEYWFDMGTNTWKVEKLSEQMRSMSAKELESRKLEAFQRYLDILTTK